MAVKLGDIVSQAGVDDYRLMKGKDLDISQGATAVAVLNSTDIFLTDVAAAGTQSSTGKVTAAVMASYFAQSQDTTVELSDVSASGTTAGQVLIYDASNSYYTPAVLTAGGNITITEADAGITIAGASGSLTVTADSGSADVVTVGTDTLTFAGTANEVDTVVTNNQIQIGLPNNVTIAGNLTVSGTTTTVSSTTLTVADKNIKLAEVDTPTKTTANGGGIQLESSGIEADWPEILWTKDKGAGNTSGAGTADGLTGWSISNMHTSNPIDLPIAVMEFKADTGAPSGNSGGVGSFCYNSNDEELYIRVAD